MASLHAFSSRKKAVSTFSVATAQSQLLSDVDFVSPYKWAYLIADNIQFSDKRPYSIRLPKPDTNTLLNWIEKLVLGGQCASIFIEDLSLDEVSFKRIKQLCMDNQVALVNLFQQPNTHTNVVMGPW